MVIKLIGFLLVAACIAGVECACSWDNCNKVSDDPNVINVHIVPHSHDDMGWLKNVDEYFYGSHNTINQAGVQYIYDGVVAELLFDENRRFSFCETGFMWRWWTSRSEKARDRMRQLVANGQMEWIGGGWTQNDEAAAHYVDIIDQMTLGLKTLMDFFGECGKAQAAWQIDPFGHSREMANLFAQMGFTSVSFARQHDNEKKQRLKDQTMEMVWNASDDYASTLFTGALYNHYEPPSGFCFDIRCTDVDPFEDNPKIPHNNVDEKIDAFILKVKEQAAVMKTNNILMLFGSDFNYMQASQYFINMDKLIKYTNARNANITALYSTPACYYKAVQDAAQRQNITWTSKKDDFFPYAYPNPHAYWAGYFTSRPAYKGMIRTASSTLQLSKSLIVVGNLGSSDLDALQVAKMASGLVQHHDSVTGTAKQAVTYDYQMQLHNGIAQAKQVISNYLGRVQSGFDATNSASVNASLCYLANETVCEAIVGKSSFQLTVFNTRGQWANETIRIPYYSQKASVKMAGSAVVSDVQPSYNIATIKKTNPNYAPYELLIAVQVPPLGFVTYSVDNSASSSAAETQNTVTSVDAAVTMENNYLQLVFDANGVLTQYYDKSTKATHKLTLQFGYYIGMDCTAINDQKQASGAYAFRPMNGTTLQNISNTPTSSTYINGTLAQEMRLQFGPWIYLIVRLRNDANYAEFDWTVGPIPGNDGISKEVVIRYATDINNNDVFYTDANGRQMMTRKRNFNPNYVFTNEEPIAANYYPITSGIYIKDGSSQMTVLTDRAESATAYNSIVEIMLHRRLFYDDNFGVDENLNEPGVDGQGLVVRGSHYLLIGDAKKAASIHRPLAMNVFHKPIIAYTQTGTNAQNLTTYSGMKAELPDQINLLTLEPWTDYSVLLRLEHIYQSNEDDTKSKPVTVDLNTLFTTFNIDKINELMLAGNRNATTSTLAGTSVTLTPMQIRTFELVVSGRPYNPNSTVLTTTPRYARRSSQFDIISVVLLLFVYIYNY